MCTVYPMSSFGLFWMCDSDNIGCGGVSGESNASKFGIGTNSFQNQLPISFRDNWPPTNSSGVVISGGKRQKDKWTKRANSRVRVKHNAKHTMRKQHESDRIWLVNIFWFISLKPQLCSTPCITFDNKLTISCSIDDSYSI